MGCKECLSLFISKLLYLACWLFESSAGAFASTSGTHHRTTCHKSRALPAAKTMAAMTHTFLLNMHSTALLMTIPIRQEASWPATGGGKGGVNRRGRLGWSLGGGGVP